MIENSTGPLAVDQMITQDSVNLVFSYFKVVSAIHAIDLKQCFRNDSKETLSNQDLHRYSNSKWINYEITL
jgi:hypothetical protein